MKRTVIAWGPAVLWAVGLFLLSELRSVPSGLRSLFFVPDKLIHFMLYLALGGLLARAKWVSETELWHAFLLVAGFGYGAVDEFHQSFVPGRTPDFTDWIADVMGIASGYLAVAWVKGWRAGDSNGVGGE